MTVMIETIYVLLVDDEPSLADLAAEFLEREDDRLTVQTATSPADGLELLSEHEIDCIVSDYDMPRTNGLEFLETVREEYSDLPFILFTGKGSEEVASDAISMGVTDYLQKNPGTDQYTLLANKISNAVERTYAERARQRHLKAIETAQEGISILNGAGRFIYVNRTYADLYGYDPEEMLGERWELIYPDDDTELIQNEILPTVFEQGAWQGKTTGLRADGSTFTESHVISKTEQDNLVCTVRDITEQLERQAELERKTRAMDEAPVGITISDPSQDDNPIIYANERFIELTGYDEPEILGRNNRFLEGAETDPEQVARLREAIDSEMPVTVELRNYRCDGTEFWNRVSIAPVEDETGEVTNYVGFHEDITEQKERERDLERYETFVESAAGGVFAHDEDGRYSYVNSYIEEQTGYDREEIIGNTPSMFLPEEDIQRISAAISELLSEDRDSITFETEITTASGETVPAEGQLALLPFDDEFQGTVGMIRDITDRKERERELKRQNERLENVTNALSHDLRNPLNVAQGSLRLATEECDSDHLTKLHDALARMETLIDELLTLAREGMQSCELELVDLAALGQRCWQTVETKDATLSTATNQTIQADPSRLQQLLENLYRNAVEYGGENVRITIGELSDGFYIADNGPGIPDAEQAKVFEAGYSTAAHGTGFGLSIVDEIVDAHGWTITVTDSEAGGARFEITGVAFGEQQSNAT